MSRNYILSGIQRMWFNSFFSQYNIFSSSLRIPGLCLCCCCSEFLYIYVLARWNLNSLAWLKLHNQPLVPLLLTKNLAIQPHETSRLSLSILDFHGTCYTLCGAHPNLSTWQIPSSQDFDQCHLTKWFPCLHQAKLVVTPLVSHSTPV